jgi:hypothetical protein
MGGVWIGWSPVCIPGPAHAASRRLVYTVVGSHNHMTTKCYRCGDELGEGVKFCVACGATQGDADASRLAGAQLEMKIQAKQSRRERFVYWWRLLMFGLRR